MKTHGIESFTIIEYIVGFHMSRLIEQAISFFA